MENVSATRKKRWVVLIPIILDLGVLLILPTVILEHGLGSGLLLGVVAMAAPWVPFFIISRAVSHEISKEKQDWEARQDREFV